MENKYYISSGGEKMFIVKHYKCEDIDIYETVDNKFIATNERGEIFGSEYIEVYNKFINKYYKNE